jgi:fructokinase
MKFMEVIADFLDWHFEKMREPEFADPVPVSDSKKIKEELEKKQSLFARMAKRIAKLLGFQKEEDVKIEVEHRKPGADTQLTVDEAVSALSADLPKILHVGSLSMTTSPGKEACEEAVKYAKENGSVISYDPNYRAALWDSEEHAIEMMKVLLPFADILKVSDEEMVMLTGTDDFEEGSLILAEYGCGLVMVTLGADGVFVRMGSHTATVPGFSVEVADTNGAGDTFLGAMLMQIAKGVSGSEDVWSQLLGMVRYANKAASLTCSRHGAIPAMPVLAEMEKEFNE